MTIEWTHDHDTMHYQTASDGGETFEARIDEDSEGDGWNFRVSQIKGYRIVEGFVETEVAAKDEIAAVLERWAHIEREQPPPEDERLLLKSLRERYMELATDYRTGSQLHKEAWNLMQYASGDGEHTEILWNSRNGVTPFGITAADDDSIQMSHVNWSADRYAPRFKPPLGMRIFVDCGPEDALEIAKTKVEMFWDHPEYPMSKSYERREQAIAHLAMEVFSSGIPPKVVEVGIDLAKRREWTDADGVPLAEAESLPGIVGGSKGGRFA